MRTHKSFILAKRLAALVVGVLAVVVISSGSSRRYDRVITTSAGRPDWIEQGPSSIAPSSSYNQSGAIESILVDPANPAGVFIGSVNGGIWKTGNATDPMPF